ncbi:hypothetical protein HELRODRAFT_174181 [Helobdella robusta]|uniref:Uncharacterized protein n=1 Tax=Helobdella robusta TaxID=6412 RepID=T1F7R1_HELRO|nr:hypothetical protein HELRODRAFT_174181 [Helobdella robusta]ESO02772.1 hypothetical protein HELRODRAFT_174181 [Helobdella robusta]
MAAIVRIKRKREEDPIESLVFVCKKAKKCYNGDEELYKIENKFKFAGTVHQPNDSLIHQTVKTAIRQCKLENERKRHCDMADDTKPSKKRKISLHKGYQIIGKKTAKTFDSLANSECNSADANPKFFIFNVEKIDQPQKKKSRNCPKRDADEKQKEINFVYDVFYINDYKFDFSLFQNVQHVEAYKQCDDVEYLAEEEEDEEAYEEDDNEDFENNWRNDYPDESSWFYNADHNFSCYDYVRDYE